MPQPHCSGNNNNNNNRQSDGKLPVLVLMFTSSCHGVRQGYLLSPCLLKLYAEHIMRNAGLDELQVGLKTGWRNSNNLRYLDDATLMAESEEELNSLLMRVKEESERAGLRLNIEKNN